METLVSEFSGVISFRKYEWLQISTNTERKYAAHLTRRGKCLPPPKILNADKKLRYWVKLLTLKHRELETAPFFKFVRPIKSVSFNAGHSLVTGLESFVKLYIPGNMNDLIKIRLTGNLMSVSLPFHPSPFPFPLHPFTPLVFFKFMDKNNM